MFNTWKQSSDSYVVLPTGPPFERPQNGKPRRSACNPCRSRKIRCTSEPTGCRNCQKRNLDCQYGTEGDAEFNIGAVKGRRQLRQRSGSGVPMSPCTYEATPEDNIASPRPLDLNEFLSEDLDRLQVEFRRMESHWSDFTFGSTPGISSGPQSPPPDGSAISPQYDTPLSSTVGMFDIVDPPPQIPRDEDSLAQPPLGYSMDTSASNLCRPDSFSFPHFQAASDAITHAEAEFTEANIAQRVPPVIDNDSSSFCVCPATALGTWETLTISISSKEPSTDDFVRCQKAAMSNCEALARCKECSSRSQDVMLLIDICAKLLESLKAQDGELSTRQRQSERRPAVYGHTTAHEVADNDDDDDGNHVLRSLWMARMQRLGRLIAKIGDLLDGEQWVAHKGLLQGVQVRFTGVMFGWQH